eukprot:ANDGO_03194.mRNA.1 putative pre-mRNA-splicing factor ATP-dependent RNA helicase mog-4
MSEPFHRKRAFAQDDEDQKKNECREDIEKNRKESRRRYLEEREKKLLRELRESVEDELALFDPSELSVAERLELEKKQQILRIVESKRSLSGLREQNSDDDAREFEERYSLLVDPSRHKVLFSAHSSEVLPGRKDPNYVPPPPKSFVIKKERERLPIFQFRTQLMDAIRENQIVIVIGETGSGKTTQLTQYLYEDGYCANGQKIGCTQPRRVAAMSVASRVSYELGKRVGTLCGYSVRFEDCSSADTRIKYMTDGMLLREFLREPELSSYSVLVVDEAHERSLHTDVVLGLVKEVCNHRKDLKLIISSATLEAEKFSSFFGGAPTLFVPGRRFPVQIKYTVQPEPDYLLAAVVTALQVHISQPAVDADAGVMGDILIFLTGQDEIERAEELLKERIRGLEQRMPDLLICPIYSALPSDQQQKIFLPTPPKTRKVVIATNIAETSLTIEGIVYVIDCGFAKVNFFNAKSNVEQLQIVPISKANAEQRAGRAGRTRPGTCFRLYTSWAFQNEMEDSNIPEIQRSNLSSVVLLLKSLGIDDIVNFPFLDPPPTASLMSALEHLYALGALTESGALSTIGFRMSEFPLEPQLARMIIASEKFGVVDEVVVCAAMLSVGHNLFYKPKGKEEAAEKARLGFVESRALGDHVLLVNLFNAWAASEFSPQFCFERFVQLRSMKRARDVRDQLSAMLDRVRVQRSSNPLDHESIRKSVCCGFFFNVAALRTSGDYKLLKGSVVVHIHPSSIMNGEFPKCVMFHELVLTSKEYMRHVCEIDPAWLSSIAPHYYSSQDLKYLTEKKPLTGKAGRR